MSIEEIKEEIPQGAEVSIYSKNEKKARAAIAKLNLRKVEGIARVTFRKRGNQIYAIESPEVFKSAAGTYIVFGEAKLEDLSQRLQQQAEAAGEEHDHEHGDHDHDHSATPTDPASITADLEKASISGPQVEEDDDEEVDLTGLKSEDLDIIIEQTGVSKNKAAKALKKHDGDLVNAIMELSN